jgi:hypothetical protein
MLRRNSCDRVKSCLAQIESTVASIVFGSRNPVDEPDDFKVRPPPYYRRGNEARRLFYWSIYPLTPFNSIVSSVESQ